MIEKLNVAANHPSDAPKKSVGAEGGKLEIEYFTDPLCCWSWAFEAPLRRLRYAFADQLIWENVMGGMLSNWSSYNDPVYCVSRPAQMGPVWTEVKHLTGMPVNDRIWIENPPKSSFPACLAVKTAAIQGTEAEEIYLRKVREAVMLYAKDISEINVLLDLAHELETEKPEVLNYQLFKNNLRKKAALNDFRKDLQKVCGKRISRYPSLIIKGGNIRRSIIVSGYKSYEVLIEAFKQIMPDIHMPKGVDLERFKKHWYHLNDQELAEVKQINTRQ